MSRNGGPPSSTRAPGGTTTGVLRVNGGRVLAVTAVADTFADAQRPAGRSPSRSSSRHAIPTRHRLESNSESRRNREWRLELPRSSRPELALVSSVPELPEVETIVRDIRPGLIGRRVRFRPAFPRRRAPGRHARRTLVRGLTGARVRKSPGGPSTPSSGPTGRRLVVQPGMTGSLIVHRSRPHRAPSGATACSGSRLDDGAHLVYRDVRRLGTLLWLDQRGWDAVRCAHRPGAARGRLHPDAFRAILARSRAAVKKVLMDQSDRRGRKHLRQRGALRRGDRSVRPPTG